MYLRKSDYYSKNNPRKILWPLLKTLIKTSEFDKVVKKQKPLSSYSKEDKEFLHNTPTTNNVKISFVASSLYLGNESNHNLEGFFRSLIKNTNTLDNVEIIIGIDQDDDIGHYIELKKKYYNKINNIRIFISEEKHGYQGLQLYDKFLYKKISPSSKMIADFSDDCKIIKKNWDKDLLKIDKAVEDNIYFIHTANFNLEKYIGPLEDNIAKMIWSYKAIAPSSYFPIFSRKVLDIATNCLKNLDQEQEKLWSPVANSYICDCYIDIIARLVQSELKSTKIFFDKIISINKQEGRPNQAKNFVKFDKNIGLCWNKTGLNINDLAFLKLSESDTASHLKFIAKNIAKEAKE